MKAIISPYLDTRREKKTGLYPLKLRLTINRKHYYWHLRDISAEDWNKINQGKYLKHLSHDALEIQDQIKKAQDIIEKLRPFTLSAFKREWEKDIIDRTNIYALFKEKIKTLNQEGRFGTERTYKNTLAAIERFSDYRSANKAMLPLVDIDIQWLSEFESWMLDEGKSETTVGIYCRNIRALFNQEISAGTINANTYPFGKSKYTIPHSKGRKMALGDSELKAIFEHQPLTEGETRAHNFWKLLYMLNGINLKDLAYLDYTKLEPDQIYFAREKTKRANKGNKEDIVVPLIKPAKKLINELKVQRTENNNLVFDLIDGYATPEQKHHQTIQAVKTINKYMARIGSELGIKNRITTYTARHSYATKLKRENTPYEVIRENLGHKSLATTEKYLASFDLEVKKSFQNKILDF